MTELVIASSQADAEAVEAVKQHHAELAGALRLRVEALLAAAAAGDRPAAEESRQDLVAWCERELLPHALAEEGAMYPAARETVEGRLLIESMLGEHTLITGLVREVAQTTDAVRAAAAGNALRVAFDSHLAKENDLVLPLLAGTPGVSVAELLGGMHELLGGHEAGGETEGAGGCGGHACACGEADRPGYPELDVRNVPHAIRHATVFGALDAVGPGSGLELVAPHDPLPLLGQIEGRWPGRFTVSYQERGPEAWRLLLLRSNG